MIPEFDYLYYCHFQIVDSVCLTDGEENYLPADGSGLVIGAEHLASQQSLCVAIATGDVILWSCILQQVCASFNVSFL